MNPELILGDQFYTYGSYEENSSGIESRYCKEHCQDQNLQLCLT